MNLRSFSSLALPLWLCASASFAVVEGLPEPSAPRSMEFVKPAEKTLGNGLRIIVVHRPGLPVLTAGFVARGGAESDAENRPGVAKFVAEMLMRGTANHSATKLAEDLEQLGASIETEATWDRSTAVLTSLTTQAEPALALLAEVVRQPTFASEEIERFRKEAIDELTVNLEQPGQLARVIAARAILGASPYGHSEAGTPHSLREISHDDLIAFHRQQYRPENSAIILAGDVRAEDGFALVEKVFGNWKGEGEAKPKAEPAPVATTPKAILIDMPKAGQAAVYVGRSADSHQSADYFIGQISNNVLGGGYSARLNREVRIKRGLSYGCGSRLTAYRDAGLFGAAAQTKNESAAEVVSVVQAELKKIGSEPVAADEFTARQLVVTGGFERELETNEGYVKRIIEFVVHGEPVDSFATNLGKLKAVTADQAGAFAAKAFAPDTTSVIVVGTGSVCEKPLRKLLPNLQVIRQAAVDLDSPTLTSSASPEKAARKPAKRLKK